MSFIRESTVAATRKRHLCNACDKWIEPGEAAVNWAGVTDGDFGSVYYHPDCRQAEIELNRANDLWNDEWVRLCDLVEREDRPWLKAEHPLPYQRLYMTREQWAAQAGVTRMGRDAEGGSVGEADSTRPEGCAQFSQDTAP